MSYDGETLDACGIIELDLSKAYVVAVSGDGPNVCGHLLLFGFFVEFNGGVLN